MATQMIDGIGEIQFRHPTAGLFAGGFASVQITGSPTSVDAKRFNAQGQLVISDSRRSESKYELTVAQETIDIRAFEMALDEVAQTSATTFYYDFFEATVPATTPFTIAAPSGVTFASDSEVMVTLFENGVWNTTTGNFTKLNLPVAYTGTSPTTGNVIVDTTDNELAFNSAQANAPIVVSYKKPVTNKLSIGVEPDPTVLTGYQFSAKLFSDAFPDGLVVICPSVSKTSLFGFQSADVATIENTFTIGLAAGKRKEIQLIQL